MSNKCDILILTASFGMGHISVSHAVKEQIKSSSCNINIEITDIFQIINPELYKGIYKGYEFLIRKNSRIYNYFYYKKSYPENLQMEEIVYKLYLPKFASYILNLKPKVIISTFPMCSGFVSNFKKRYKNNIPLITCITDVIDNSEWLFPGTDKYFVAAESVKFNLARRGINEDIIKITGIPIRKGFLDIKKNKVILKEFGIEKNDFVIMIMGGGMGMLPDKIDFYHWLNDLKDVKTLVLTGHNHELYKKLNEHKNLVNIKVLKYIDNVHQLMVNSDLLISKAGGVTVFEAIASRLPIIAYKPILGQEIENSKFILDMGIGSIAQDLNLLKREINHVLKYEEYRDTLNNNINNIRNQIDMNNLSRNILANYNAYNIDAYYEEAEVL